MKLINDINVLLKLNGTGATHSRLSVDSDINLAEWVVVNDDCTMPFTIPNVYGIYNVSFQLKNPYGESDVITEQISYVEAIDNESPSEPSSLTISSISSDSLTISWAPSIDNIGVSGYRVECGGLTFNTNLTTYTIQNLSPITQYTVLVIAKDSLGNESLPASIVATTTNVQVATPIQGNVVIAQVFCPTSTVVNTQDGICIDHCFTTLYNKSDNDIDLSAAKLYWKYEAYPTWHKVNLSGTIKANSYFLIRGSKLTGMVAGTNILMDWSLRVPDLDCSVDWSTYVDSDPLDTVNAESRQIQWAVDHNMLFIGSKTGALYLSANEHVGELPNNPFIVKSTLPDYVDEVGLLGSGEINIVSESAPISGTKKTMIANRKITSGITQDTDNNNADFALTSVMLLTTGDVIALIKNSTHG